MPGTLELSKDTKGRLAELKDLSKRAEDGEKNARSQLRRLVRSSSPEVVAEASSIARCGERMLIKTISGGESLLHKRLSESAWSGCGRRSLARILRLWRCCSSSGL